MRSIDPLMTKVSSDDYQCAHFVRDAWEYLTGAPLSSSVEGFLLPPNERTAANGLRDDFTHVKTPSGLCIAIFRRLRGRPHTGLFFNGRILELVDTGVRYVPLHVPMVTYTSVRFYEPAA